MSLSNRRSFALVVALALCGLAGLALAGTTRSWRLSSFKEFEEGEATGVRIRSQGELVPGVALTRHELDAAVVYSSVVLPDGNVVLGGGDDGQVWTVEHGAVRSVGKVDATLVTSLVLGDGGRVWAGALPGGKIFALDVAKGAATPVRELVTLDADHVWAMAWVAARSTLYAATGPKGRLYAIEVRGGVAQKPRLVWDSGEKQLLSMVVDEDGALIVGSSEQAIVYRVVDDGGKTPHVQVEALHDFEGDEIRALARRGRTLYVAVNEFQKTSATTTITVTAPRGTKIALPTATTATPPVGMPARDRKGKGAVFRLDPDGRIEQLHALGDGYFTALSVETTKSEDVVWAASGGEGRVYRISADRSVETAIDISERQVLTLAADEHGRPRALGAGDAAAWYEIKESNDKNANYTTKVLDAQFTARWGRLRWSGRGDLVVDTRTGNTVKPDKTWSGWQHITVASDEHEPGEEVAGGQIASPRARYVQARIGFAHAAADAVVRDLSIYYVPQNQAARVVEVTAGDESVHRRRPHSPAVKVRWRVENPDEDDVVYRVFYRLDGEPTWRPLPGGGTAQEPIARTELDWMTDGLPDGHYRVRVVASDERSNPAALALTTELTSTPVLVDNRKPEVVDLRVAADHNLLTATGRARDSYSPLVELTFSVDGGEWQPLLPRDGVCDARTEELSFSLPRDLTPGAHSLAVRAYDSADNVGAAQIAFTK